MIINKKGIGFIIACVFWLGILPIGLLQLIPYGEEFKVEELYADGLSGDGTAVYPYIVEDADDLKKVKDNLGAYYKQMADIDLSGIPNWPPIDNFEGTYDGNGYEIRNLRIVSTGDRKSVV